MLKECSPDSCRYRGRCLVIVKIRLGVGDRQGAMFGPVTLDLVGIAEVAEILGVSTQRVDQIARTDATFPPPVAELRAGRIWQRHDVNTWAQHTGRTTPDQ